MTEDMMVSGAMLEEIGTTSQTHYDCVGDDSVEEELPESLNVLFVDDEAILRKLFIRSVKRISPDWNISEAGNVDAALRMVQENDFDMIFLDQYMPSTGRPILGTEAVREMRAIGVSCTICGLSANDQAAEFMKAGADGFIMKPFPCNKRRLKKEMLRLLLHGRRVISVSS
jgi:CheY-like chemotaxis protein